jgi:threonine/homoserine/homoserine lactone efflux protein
MNPVAIGIMEAIGIVGGLYLVFMAILFVVEFWHQEKIVRDALAKQRRDLAFFQAHRAENLAKNEAEMIAAIQAGMHVG